MLAGDVDDRFDEPQLLRLVVRTQPLDPELDRGLKAVEESAVAEPLEPPPDLLVAGAARLGAEVVPRGEPDDETDPKLHGFLLPHFEESHRVLCGANTRSVCWTMGYRGKVEQHEQARILRAQNMTLLDIATQLGVSKSSVSTWVRDVPFTPSKRRHGPHRRPHAQRVAKLKQIEDLDAARRDRIGRLDESSFLAAGVALYAGEGAKRDASVTFANVRPRDDPVALRLVATLL